MSHHKLNRYECEKIAQMHYSGYSVIAIAKAVGRHKSTVSRKLRRPGEGDHIGARAQEDAYAKQKNCHPKRRLSDEALNEYTSAHPLNFSTGDLRKK